MRPLDSGVGRKYTRGAEANFRPGARRGPPEMACSRESTSRMYVALENGSVVHAPCGASVGHGACWRAPPCDAWI